MVTRSDTTSYRAEATLARGAEALGGLGDLLRQRNRLDAQIVELVGELTRSGTVEHLEGLPLELHPALEHRLTRAERWMLITAAQVLAHLPTTAGLFRDGTLSWSQVRGIVDRARHLPVADRGALDERIAASVDLLDRLDPDQLQWAVDRAADELEGARQVEAREQRAERANFLHVGLRWGLEVVRGVRRGRHRRRPQRPGPRPRPCRRATRPRRAPLGPWRKQRRVQTFVDLCADALGRAGSKARALVVVHIDLDRVMETAAGVLEVNVPCYLPTISAAAVERLCHDADLQAVLFAGARPLATSAKVNAAHTSRRCPPGRPRPRPRLPLLRLAGPHRLDRAPPPRPPQRRPPP